MECVERSFGKKRDVEEEAWHVALETLFIYLFKEGQFVVSEKKNSSQVNLI